jgi:hypothetical protein
MLRKLRRTPRIGLALVCAALSAGVARAGTTYYLYDTLGNRVAVLDGTAVSWCQNATAAQQAEAANTAVTCQSAEVSSAASALTVDPVNCGTTNWAAQGIAADGTAQGCFPVATETHAHALAGSAITGALPLAKLTDDVASGKCLLSGGGAGDPVWGSCPGGGGASGAVLPDYGNGSAVPLNTIQQAAQDGWLNLQMWGPYMNGLRVLVGRTSPPTIGLYIAGDDLNTDRTKAPGGAMLPIRAGDYYKVENGVSGWAGGYAFENVITTWFPGLAATAADSEAWRYVGAAGQPAFTNGWGNSTLGSPPPTRFRKVPGNRVEVQIAIVGGASTTVSFTLPAGYRPSGLLHVIGNNGVAPIVGSLSSVGAFTVYAPVTSGYDGHCRYLFTFTADQ